MTTTTCIVLRFLSTLSLRRATLGAWKSCNVCRISIHALLAESDLLLGSLTCLPLDFYPRSPCGERQPSSTRKLTNMMISIHALLAESDKSLLTRVVSSADFYPRSPCGERPMQIVIVVMRTLISIHALLAESDEGPAKTAKADRFLSTLSLRRAT